VKEHGLAGSFWPTPAQKLLVQSALAEDERWRDAWDRLRTTLVLDEVEPGSFPLLPLLYRRLEQDGGDNPLTPRLKGMYRRTWYVNQVRLERLLPAVVALQDADIDPLVLSGWELACHYYDDLGSRPVDGVHVFVSPEHVRESVRVLSGVGWAADFNPTPEALRSRYSVWLSDADNSNCVVHWRLFHEFVGPATEAADLRDFAIDFRLGDRPARALGPADELLNVCVSGARTSPWQNLQWLADAAVVLRTHGDLDWDRVLRQAESRRAVLRLRDALVYLVRTIGAPVPEQVLSRLDRVAATRRERLAHRAGGWKTKAPESMTRYLRATASSSVPAALVQLPSFLRDEWGLERRSQVPLAVAQKAARRLAGPVRTAARADR
jgi:Uncharacterised nucleotidyltransferase